MSVTGREPGPAAANPGPSQDERGELPGQEASPVRRQRWRTLVATILIVVGCLLAPVSVLAVWAANEVSNTGRYVATMEPLVHNPAIQNALTGKITTEITTRLNVTSYADQAAAALSSRGLPKASTLLKSVAPSIASGVAGYIHNEVHKIVTGPRFAQAWVQANTVAHQELVKALSGQGNSVSVKNGQVVVALGPLIDVVKQDLVKRGFTIVSKIPADQPDADPVLGQVPGQGAIGVPADQQPQDRAAGADAAAAGPRRVRRRGRRRALIGAGLGLAASMLVPAVGLYLFRDIYLGSVPSDVLPADAAAALFDALVRFIKEGLRTVLVAGLVVAAGAFLTGPSATAVRTRHALTTGWAVSGRAASRPACAPARQEGGPMRTAARCASAPWPWPR